MISLTKFFKIFSSNFDIKDITKEILGIYVPMNAPTLAKVAAAEMVKKKMKELFVKEYAIVLNVKNIDQIKEILIKNNIKFEVGNFFKGEWKGFNEKSFSICFENISFNKIKDIALEIVKTFKQEMILKDVYNIFLISS